MNELRNGVIQRKLALLDTQVGNLESHLRGVSIRQFTDDWMLRSMAERALQVAAEVVIDVAERIIALRGGGPAATAADAIRRLEQLGVLQAAETYVGIVRFRNMIVHQYEEIRPDIVYDLASNRLGVFRRFREEIDLFVAGAEE